MHDHFSLIWQKWSESHATFHETKPSQYFLLCIRSLERWTSLLYFRKYSDDKLYLSCFHFLVIHSLDCSTLYMNLGRENKEKLETCYVVGNTIMNSKYSISYMCNEGIYDGIIHVKYILLKETCLKFVVLNLIIRFILVPVEYKLMNYSLRFQSFSCSSLSSLENSCLLLFFMEPEKSASFEFAALFPSP